MQICPHAIKKNRNDKTLRICVIIMRQGDKISCTVGFDYEFILSITFKQENAVLSVDITNIVYILYYCQVKRLVVVVTYPPP